MPTKTPHLALCSILLASIPSLSYAHKLQSPESDTSINTQIGTLSNSSLPEYRENILAVILPNGHGGFETYTDSDAQVAYDTFIKSIDQDGILPTVEEESNLSEMETTQEITNNKESSAEQDLIPAKNIKYRFINVRRGITWGKNRRISQYVTNHSSGAASLSLSASNSVATTYSTSLSGGFEDAFKATVGGSWGVTKTGSVSISVNVQPSRQAWIEFRPMYNTVSGKLQKYFIPRRYPNGRKPVVLETKKIYSESSAYTNVSFGRKTFKVPDGAYVIKDRRI